MKREIYFAKAKATDEEGGDIEQVTPDVGPVDLTVRVKVECTDKAPHHKAGEISEMSPVLAKKFEANGWGKILATVALLVTFLIGSDSVSGQSTAYQKLARVSAGATTPTNLLIFSDTVTNTATNYLTTGYPQSGTSYGGSVTAIVNPSFSTTLQVNITKISGTVAGTVTIQGSVDGVNYSTVINPQYAASFASTATPTNVATQSFSWTLANNPYRFYRISYTGAGTMSASMTGYLWSH